MMVRDQHLNALEWSRGLLASTALLGLCAYSLGAGARIPRKSGMVYAAIQAVAAAQSQSSETSQDSGPISGNPHRKFLQFDVAIVRENKSGRRYTSFPLTMGDDYYVPTHGYMQMIGLPVAAYIQFAYNLDPNHVVAVINQLPNWANSTRYDIEARVEGEPNKDDMRTMMRALLADRFGLQLHAETRLDKVYDLVLAKPGRIGRTLHEHPSDDPTCKQDRPQISSNPCGTIAHVPDPNTNLLQMVGRRVSMAQFVLSASSKVDRTIIDKTGLTGKYDFTLQFVPPKVGGGLDPNASEPPVGTTFTDALQDQMGLKLVPDKGPVTRYVLDRIEKPSEN